MSSADATGAGAGAAGGLIKVGFAGVLMRNVDFDMI